MNQPKGPNWGLRSLPRDSEKVGVGKERGGVFFFFFSVSWMYTPPSLHAHTHIQIEICTEKKIKKYTNTLKTHKYKHSKTYTGTVSLLKNSAYGILGTFGQVTGGFSKGLAVLSMDEKYRDRFRNRPLGNRQRVVAGFHNLKLGVKDGLVGVVRDPLHGWQEEGASGLARGVATGVVCVCVF